MNALPIISPGFGLGLRTAHYHDFLSAPQRVDWLEIITDNFLVDGGKPLRILDTLRRDYPVAMHGVAMSIGSAAGLDRDYLARVKRLARRIEPLWISDHLCWTGAGANVLHDLYPLPYTEESARVLIAQIRQAQDILERRLVVENVSSYVRFISSTMSEWAFLSHVIDEADCELLLDVNNVYVSSINHGFSAKAYLDGLPAARVRQMHLAGHCCVGEHIIDTHDGPVAPEVWALYAYACRRFPHVATMIERDDDIPPLAQLIAELDRAREIAATVAVQSEAIPCPQVPRRTHQAGVAGELAAIQHRLAQCILSVAPAPVPDSVDSSGSLPGLVGMHIYHRAYRDRLTEVLADSYAKCARYLGTDVFKELAYRYINGRPPQQRHLGHYGDHFASSLQESYPGNPELHELAQLEWALREVFDSADVAAWTVPAIERDGAPACLICWPILHPSVRVQWVHSNAVAIWRAIDDDENVPEVVCREQAQALVVWRKGLQPHFRSLDCDEAHFLEALVHDGASISIVAQTWEASGKLSDPARLASWLAGWWSDELLRIDAGTSDPKGAAPD